MPVGGPVLVGGIGTLLVLLLRCRVEIQRQAVQTSNSDF